MVDRDILKELLGAFMRVEQPDLQVEDRLAGDAEQKMSRLDDARMHRANGHLEHTFAFHLAEFVPLARETAAARCAGRSLCAADKLPASHRAAHTGAGWDVPRA